MRRIKVLFAVMAAMFISPAFAAGSVGGSGAGNDYAVGTNGSKMGGGSEGPGTKAVAAPSRVSASTAARRGEA